MFLFELRISCHLPIESSDSHKVKTPRLKRVLIGPRVRYFVLLSMHREAVCMMRLIHVLTSQRSSCKKFDNAPMPLTINDAVYATECSGSLRSENLSATNVQHLVQGQSTAPSCNPPLALYQLVLQLYLGYPR